MNKNAKIILKNLYKRRVDILLNIILHYCIYSLKQCLIPNFCSQVASWTGYGTRR